MPSRLTSVCILLILLSLPACTDQKPPEAAPPAQQRVGAVIPAKPGYVMSEFSVEGMHCDDCTTAIRKKLTKLPGVVGVDAEYDKGRVQVTYDPQRVHDTQLKSAIEELKFKVVGFPNPVSVPAGSTARAAGPPKVVGVAGDKATQVHLPPMGREMPPGSRQLKYTVDGIKDSAIEIKITKGVASLKGVYHVHASHVTGAVVVDYDPKTIDAQKIEAKLHALGFAPKAQQSEGGQSR